MKRNKIILTVVIPVVILAAGFFVMQFFSGLREEPEKKKPEPRTKIVQSVLVNPGNVKADITAFGRVRSSQPVVLTSEVSGEIMKGTLPFQPAQSFKKGDLLLKIDDRQIKLELNITKSDFLNALAQVLPEIKLDFPEEYTKWQNYFNQCTFESKLQPLPEAANQKIKLFLTRFNVYKLYFTVQNLEINLAKHYFYAPFNGSIISADLRLGSTARNGTRLGEIINLDDMEVSVPIASQDIQWIEMSQPVSFTSTEIPGEWLGRIKRVGKTIDTQTQTVPIYISVNNAASSNLFDGVFLKAKIPGKIITDAIVVPRKAMYEDEHVYLIENGKLSYRKVEIARQEKETVIIKNGFNKNDTLVIELMQGVFDGLPAVPILNSEDEAK